MLPNATLDQKIATGFNRNHRGNGEGGIIPEEYAVEYVVDRVDTTSTVWLGLTVGCARCHDHKYDPITQKEFYQLFAYFNNVPERGKAFKYGNSPPFIPAPTPAEQAQQRAARRQSGRGRPKPSPRLDVANGAAGVGEVASTAVRTSIGRLPKTWWRSMDWQNLDGKSFVDAGRCRQLRLLRQVHAWRPGSIRRRRTAPS